MEKKLVHSQRTTISQNRKISRQSNCTLTKNCKRCFNEKNGFLSNITSTMHYRHIQNMYLQYICDCNFCLFIKMMVCISAIGIGECICNLANKLLHDTLFSISILYTVPWKRIGILICDLVYIKRYTLASPTSYFTGYASYFYNNISAKNKILIVTYVHIRLCNIILLFFGHGTSALQ